MCGEAEHITFRPGVAHQVLAQDFVLLKDLHSVEFLRRLALFADQVDGSKATLSKRLNHIERVQRDFAKGCWLAAICIIISILNCDQVWPILLLRLHGLRAVLRLPVATHLLDNLHELRQLASLFGLLIEYLFWRLLVEVGLMDLCLSIRSQKANDGLIEIITSDVQRGISLLVLWRDFALGASHEQFDQG